MEHAVVVAGDAVAAKKGKIFEKPGSLDEAIEFLGELSGSEFQFVTSLAVLHADSGKLLSTVGISNIRFRPLIEREIRDYVRRHPVLEYGGAFDGDGVLRFGESISGSCNIFTQCRSPNLRCF